MKPQLFSKILKSMFRLKKELATVVYEIEKRVRSYYKDKIQKM